MGDFLSALGDVLSAETAYSSAVRFAAVLAFAAIGEWIAERAGTLNISVEGMMLSGAFASAMGYDATSNVVVGLVLGMVFGVVVDATQHRDAIGRFRLAIELHEDRAEALHAFDKA
jgi:simple sugar transport system permease protein